MKNILIITYYWPPTGGVGTQRWLKLSKYLFRNKLKPIIYTPSNPTSPIKDLSTIDDIEKGVEVIKKDIFEPNKFFSIFNTSNPSSHILTKRPTSFSPVSPLNLSASANILRNCFSVRSP